jgi:hypothetical protein
MQHAACRIAAWPKMNSADHGSFLRRRTRGAGDPT